MKSLSYVLMTAARNEAALIEGTILSVVGQSVPPVKWVIVSDGSTDGTDEIVRRHASVHPWIELMQMPPRDSRHFGGKAVAVNAGYNALRPIRFDLVGNLDADITFEPDYFEFLIQKFADNERLGVGGTPFREENVQYDYRFSRKEHVSGACQLFRRQCFEAIGGYVPRKEGGIDLAAVVTARMKGWRTETFPEKVCVHHRLQGTAGRRFVTYTFRSGYGDYVLGVHPLWQAFRSVYQMTRRPVFVTGFLLLAGYLWAWLTRAPKPVPQEFVRFRGREQIGWLKEYYRKALKWLE